MGGVTLYSGKPSTMGFSMKCLPGLNVKRLARWFKNVCFPFIDFYDSVQMLVKQKGKTAGLWEIVSSVFVTVIFYNVGWIVVILEHLLPSDLKQLDEGNTYFTRGVAVRVDGMVKNLDTIEISDRFGHFRKYANEWTPGTQVELPTSFHPNRYETMAVGDRVTYSQHLAVFGWFGIFSYISCVAILRCLTREQLKIKGNMAEDFFVAMFFWPSVLTQVNEELTRVKDGKRTVPEKNNNSL